jgi:capsule synthesis protein PGA_cap
MTNDIAPIRLAAVGDIFFGDHYFTLGHGIRSRLSERDAPDMLREVAPVLAGADIAIGNLEGPLSHSSSQPQTIEKSAFRGIPEFSEVLKAANFTHLNVANNHSMQHGEDAFYETIDALNARKLRVVGLDGKSDGHICAPVVEEVRGRRICLLGYSNVPERYSKRPLYAHFEDEKPVVAEIAELSRQFDEVIVSCHAGDEGLGVPSRRVVEMFAAFEAAGARCVLGHHSHVFQPVHHTANGLIAYSLGNFVFDLLWDPDTLDSAILLVDIEPGKIRSKLCATEFTSAYRVKRLGDAASARFNSRLEDLVGEMRGINEPGYRQMLEAYERRNGQRKNLFFLTHMLRGATSQKMAFLLGKITRRAST